MSEETASGLTREAYAAIAAFRLELRRFLAFSEAAAGKVGFAHSSIRPFWQSPAAIGRRRSDSSRQQLTHRAHTPQPNSSRAWSMRGLLEKTTSSEDRRRSALTLTTRAADLLQQLTAVHLEELRTLEPALARALMRLHRQGADA